MAKLQPGCLRFDSASSIEGGWASVDGCKAFRFRNVSDLESDFFFLSNIGFNESHKTGLSNTSKIRTNSYFDVNYFSIQERENNKKIQNNMDFERLNRSPNDMIAQLGIDDLDWEKQVESISLVASRIYEEAVKSFDLEKPPFYELKKGIREKIIPPDYVIKDPKLFDALESSTVHFSLVNRQMNSIQNDVDYGINLTIPKAKHSFDILSKPLPAFDTQWKLLSKKISDINVPKFLEGIDQRGIYLFRVNIKSLSDEYGHIVNFGTGKEQRTWITGIDALFLKDIAKFDIYQGYEAIDVIDSSEIYPLLTEAYNPLQHDYSYSTGIFLQNVWASLAISQKPKANIVRNYDSFNQFTPFLKAYDRIELIKKVKMLDDKDIIVTSYGKSELKVVLKDYQIKPEIFDIFESTNLIPYGLKLDMSEISVNPDEPLSILRKLYMGGRTNDILTLDKKFYKSL